MDNIHNINIRQYWLHGLHCLIILLLAVAVQSCMSGEPLQNELSKRSAKIAVVLPGGKESDWKEVVDFALENYREAAIVLPEATNIEVEWRDENEIGLDNWLKQIADDDSFTALIGPYTSQNAESAIEAFAKCRKPILLPMATSVEVQRANAGKEYVWNLAESDITQCELLLSQFALSEISTVSLLACEGEYGKSFTDWFAYQAEEAGLHTGRIITYHDAASLRDAALEFTDKSLAFSGLLFVPGCEEDLLTFDGVMTELESDGSIRSYPMTLCTDIAYTSSLGKKLKHRFEGISPSADPSCGFINIFRQRLGRLPMAGEAQVFDAFSLIAYALARPISGNLNDDILAIVDGRTPWGRSWMATDMGEALRKLSEGETPDLNGVTGDWTFDARHHASPLNTIYCHWILNDGEYNILEYLSMDGSGQTTSSRQLWDDENSAVQQFNKDQDEIAYGAKKGNYAVVIGASDTWADYRHQADALAMYSMLRRHGYDDDHIILIIADNIAYDPHNLYPGTVKVIPDGENLYAEAKIDYRLGDLKVSDLWDIISGRKTLKCPTVLESDSADNVLFFWCGHGNAGKIAWGSEDFIYGFQFARKLEEMASSGKFRKLFLCMDTCYSGSVGEACEGIPGLLVMTSARANEPSKADMRDPEMGIWLSNGFTRVFQETIDDNPSISVSDLYYQVARHTTGSHATVYNLQNYGNAYHSVMSEFLR